MVYSFRENVPLFVSLISLVPSSNEDKNSDFIDKKQPHYIRLTFFHKLQNTVSHFFWVNKPLCNLFGKQIFELMKTKKELCSL